MTKRYSMDDLRRHPHATYSPSDPQRWLNCPPSAQLPQEEHRCDVCGEEAEPGQNICEGCQELDDEEQEMHESIFGKGKGNWKDV